MPAVHLVADIWRVLLICLILLYSNAVINYFKCTYCCNAQICVISLLMYFYLQVNDDVILKCT